MGRLLLIAGALACLALHAQDNKTHPPPPDWQNKALQNALKGANSGRAYTLRAGKLTVSGFDSPVCMAPMPIVKPSGGDSDMVVRAPRAMDDMPVIAPPPTCGQPTEQFTK